MYKWRALIPLFNRLLTQETSSRVQLFHINANLYLVIAAASGCHRAEQRVSWKGWQSVTFPPTPPSHYACRRRGGGSIFRGGRYGASGAHAPATHLHDGTADDGDTADNVSSNYGETGKAQTR